MVGIGGPGLRDCRGGGGCEKWGGVKCLPVLERGIQALGLGQEGGACLSSRGMRWGGGPFGGRGELHGQAGGSGAGDLCSQAPGDANREGGEGKPGSLV